MLISKPITLRPVPMVIANLVWYVTVAEDLDTSGINAINYMATHREITIHRGAIIKMSTGIIIRILD